MLVITPECMKLLYMQGARRGAFKTQLSEMPNSESRKINDYLQDENESNNHA